MYVLLFDVFYWMSSLIKEINNRLISKGIYVLLFYIFNDFNDSSVKEINRYAKHLLLRKTDVLKLQFYHE